MRMRMKTAAVLAACAAAVLAAAATSTANPADELSKIVEKMTVSGERSGPATEEDLAKRAEETLKERYGIDFVIEEENRVFSQKNGTTGSPSTLRAYAHPKKKEKARFYVIVEEKGPCRDNYSALARKDDVEDLVSDRMMDAGLTSDVTLTYSATEEPIPDWMTAEDILYDGRCTMYFEPELEDEDSPEGYVGEIRKWMDFLYPLDYNWYMEVKRKSDGEVIFTLDPHDNGFTESGDWKDSLIAGYVEDCLYRISMQTEDRNGEDAS